MLSHFATMEPRHKNQDYYYSTRRINDTEAFRLQLWVETRSLNGHMFQIGASITADRTQARP
jgi:hypothetical protein